MADADLSHGAAWSQLSPVARVKFLCTAKEFVDKSAKAVTLRVGVETEANWGTAKSKDLHQAPGTPARQTPELVVATPALLHHLHLLLLSCLKMHTVYAHQGKISVVARRTYFLF